MALCWLLSQIWCFLSPTINTANKSVTTRHGLLVRSHHKGSICYCGVDNESEILGSHLTCVPIKDVGKATTFYQVRWDILISKRKEKKKKSKIRCIMYICSTRIIHKETYRIFILFSPLWGKVSPRKNPPTPFFLLFFYQD